MTGPLWLLTGICLSATVHHLLNDSAKKARITAVIAVVCGFMAVTL